MTGMVISAKTPITLIAIAAAMSIFQIVMYVAVSFLDQPVLAIVAIVSWGAATGCYAPLTSAAIPALFGRRNLGAIAGFQMSAMVIGSAVGPALFALVESITGRVARMTDSGTATP